MNELIYNSPENHNYPNNNNSSYPIYADASLPEFTFFLIICVSCTTSFYRLWSYYLKKCINSRKTKNLLKPRTVTSNDEVNLLNECTICLEKYKKKEKIIELPCDHNFHEVCIKEWFEKDNKSCPNCRENII